MSERLMSHAELARVTGYKRHSKQAAWFKLTFRFDVVRCSDGSIVITWATFEALQAKKAGVLASPITEERPALRAIK